jgi:hypothetical protein
MHKNVNINNKMLSLVFYRVIKATIIAEKIFITRVIFSAMLAAFNYHPIKHQRKHLLFKVRHT